MQNRRLASLSLAALEQVAKANPHDPDAGYYYGLRLNEAHRYNEAAAVLKTAAEADPEQARIREQWMRALVAGGHPTVAYEELSQYARQFPGKGASHRLLGQFYIEQHSWQRGLAELNRAAAIDPSDRLTWILLAAARDGSYDLQGAVAAVEKAITLGSASAGEHLYLGSLYLRENRGQEALREDARALEMNPALPGAHREYARALLAEGSRDSLQKAAEEAAAAVQSSPDDSAAQEALGEALMRTGKPQAALAPLLQAARLNPFDAASARLLCSLYASMGNTARSAVWQARFVADQHDASETKRLEDRAELHPDDMAAHRGLALLRVRHGDAEGALLQFASTLHVTPDSSLALDTTAHALIAQGYPAAGEALARRAVMTDGSDVRAHELLADALLASGHPSEAKAEYSTAAANNPNKASEFQQQIEAYEHAHGNAISSAEMAYRQAVGIETTAVGPKHITPQVEQLAQRAVTLDPTSVPYLTYLLHVQITRRYNDQAIETAQRILKLAPRDANAHILLGILLVDRAAGEEALREVEQNLTAVPAPDRATQAEQYYGLGLLAMRRHDWPRAVNALTQSLKLDPEADVTYYKLALAETAAGKPEEAARFSGQYRARQAVKRRLADMFEAIARSPRDPSGYERAASYMTEHGMADQAMAVRDAERRNTGAPHAATGSS